MSSFTILALCCAVLAVSEVQAMTLGGVVGQDDQVCFTLPRNFTAKNQRIRQGVPGKRGPVGATGSRGFRGQKGIKGSSGRSGLRGPAGATGPRGYRGRKGEPGDVKSCGCNTGDISKLREQVRALRDLQFCVGGLIYNNQCIRLVYPQGPGVTFTKAQQVCSNLNAALVEITSNEMYNIIYNYVKYSWIQYTDSNRRSWKYVELWLGSSFEPSTRNINNLITLRNGRKIRSGNWFHGYPYKGLSRVTYVRMGLTVQLGDDITNTGIWNYYVTYDTPVPLCASQLPIEL